MAPSRARSVPAPRPDTVDAAARRRSQPLRKTTAAAVAAPATAPAVAKSPAPPKAAGASPALTKASQPKVGQADKAGKRRPEPKPPKPEKEAKAAKPAKPAKLEKSAKPAKPAPAVAAERGKPALVRDSFAIPSGEYEVFAALKHRLALRGRLTKKTELLRAGLSTLAALDDAGLQAAVDRLEVIPTGRPKKKSRG